MVPLVTQDTQPHRSIHAQVARVAQTKGATTSSIDIHNKNHGSPLRTATPQVFSGSSAPMKHQRSTEATRTQSSSLSLPCPSGVRLHSLRSSPVENYWSSCADISVLCTHQPLAACDSPLNNSSHNAHNENQTTLGRKGGDAQKAQRRGGNR